MFPHKSQRFVGERLGDRFENGLDRGRCQILNSTQQMCANIYNETFIIVEEICLFILNNVLLYVGNISPKFKKKQQYDAEA